MNTEILTFDEKKPSLDSLAQKSQENIESTGYFIEQWVPQTEAFVERNSQECVNFCDSPEGFLNIITAHKLQVWIPLENS